MKKRTLPLLGMAALLTQFTQAQTSPAAASVAADAPVAPPPGVVPAAPGQPGMPAMPTDPSGYDFPPLAKVLEGYQPVISTSDGQPGFYNLWRREKDQGLLAQLPKNFAQQKHFFALTVASGEAYAGLQSGEVYAYWAQYGNKLALIEPNLKIRSTGDDPSKASVKRLFTDRVLLEVPILTIPQNQGPVIDLDALLIGQAERFFGPQVAGIRKDLLKIKTAKTFPENIEIGLEVPVEDGKLRTLHYSISLMKETSGYQPRVADTRVGFFTTSYTDFGKFTPDEARTRYINRWFLEKADPSLKLSPPKVPIKFYIEHSTPVRYRRWVKDGLLIWNKAFERIGIVNAIEVEDQDAATNKNMDKDPEDVRYNFIRWLNNGVGTAIGPSRTNPLTGQILDADIVLTDGWIRHWWAQYNEFIPQVAIEGMSPETLEWMWQNPQWDPRVRLAPPEERSKILSARAAGAMPALGGHPIAQGLGETSTSTQSSPALIGKNEYEGLMGRFSQKMGLCMAPNCKTSGLAMMEMELAISGPESVGLAAGDQQLDGIPEAFIGPLLIDLVAHEVGHTLGLRHNFKASSVYTYEQINSADFKGKKPFTGSVMDYIPINIVAGNDPAKKGDFGMISVGPYDDWAIEYGYTLEKDLKPILARVAEPELTYATDEDSIGPDPLARRYDFAKDPLPFAENQIALVKEHRAKILDKFVKDGDSWSRARRGYQMTLRTQTQALSMMSSWLGGTFVNRDKKGDKNGRNPVEPVPVDMQRKALAFCLANSFRDEAYGLTPDLLAHMTVDKWYENEMEVLESPSWPVHDQILGLQASVLSSVMNPVTLGRVLDNEMRIAADQDAVTLPEVLETVRKAAWEDLDAFQDAGQYSPRKPFLSSLRRNLQREHIERLIDLATTTRATSASQKPISDLASGQLAELKAKIEGLAGKPNLDAYSKAHLREAVTRISKALDARYLLK